MDQPVYKVDHRYNPSPAWVSDFSKARMANHVGSFRADIEQMLSEWRLLQSKKQDLEEQQPRRDIKTEVKQHLVSPSDDFERIMEEDLGRQLEALKLEEEEQYQRMKKSIEDDLKQRSRFEAEAREQWTLMKELDRLEDEEKKQRKLWRQNQLLYVRQAMQKAAQLKARKMLQLLELCRKSKAYHFQRANSKKWSR